MKRSWDRFDGEAEREGAALDFFDKLMSEEQEVPTWVPKVGEQPTPKQQALLDLIHPLGPGHPRGLPLTLPQAAEQLSISRQAAWARLTCISRDCPKIYAEWARWPSAKQMELIWYLSPHYAGLTVAQVAVILQVTEPDIYQRVRLIQEQFPQVVFRFPPPRFILAPNFKNSTPWDAIDMVLGYEEENDHSIIQETF